MIPNRPHNWPPFHTKSLGVVLALLGFAPLSLARSPQAFGQAPPALRTGTEVGFGLFQQHCTACHGNQGATVIAPAPATLRQLTPEAIYDALANGVMKVQAQGLTDEEKRRIAESMSGRPLGTATMGSAKQMPNQCTTNSPFAGLSALSQWNGWGAGLSNTRFQPQRAAGLSTAAIPNLKLKWAFGYPGGVSAFGQPAVVAGRVFVGADTGYVYSLDASTGCVYWSFQAKAGVRAAITVASIEGYPSAKFAAFVGDLKANVYALDALTGDLLWSRHVEQHFTARITGAPALYAGRLYVPVSSFEEFSAKSLDYSCCTSRGSVVALDVNTGAQIWKTYTIPRGPKPTKKNSAGTLLYAPAGASVWNSPTVDPLRHAIYFGTGDSETEPAAPTSDSVMALDMKTGKILWVYQAQANDAFLVGCRGEGVTENCPREEGPDFDIGNSPMLRDLPSGKRILIAGTKDGDAFGLDPDNRGALLWRTRVSDERNSGIYWGGAADERNAYFGLSGGGAVSIQLETGKRRWFSPLNPRGTHIWNAAAVTAIPGAVFIGGGDGKLHAISSETGQSLWEYDTDLAFQTVNTVDAKGGSIRAAGVTVAGGMLFVGSGYAVFPADIPGNVLLAFSPE